MRRSVRVLLTAGIVLVAACSGGDSPPAVTGDSGIEGTVTIGPTCPVVTPDANCDDRPFAAELVIVERGTQRLVARTRSGADGRFRVALAPGEYTILPATRGSGPPIGAPVDATVRRGAFTTVTVTFDSGIR